MMINFLFNKMINKRSVIWLRNIMLLVVFLKVMYTFSQWIKEQMPINWPESVNEIFLVLCLGSLYLLMKYIGMSDNEKHKRFVRDFNYYHEKYLIPLVFGKEEEEYSRPTVNGNFGIIDNYYLDADSTYKSICKKYWILIRFFGYYIYIKRGTSIYSYKFMLEVIFYIATFVIFAMGYGFNFENTIHSLKLYVIVYSFRSIALLNHYFYIYGLDPSFGIFLLHIMITCCIYLYFFILYVVERVRKNK